LDSDIVGCPFHEIIDPFFISYTLITIFLLVGSFFILRKSLSTVNYLFSLSPLTLAIVGILNMLRYFVIVPDFIPHSLYLLRTLGIFFAGAYILKGNQLIHNKKIMGFTLVYVVYALVLSFNI